MSNAFIGFDPSTIPSFETDPLSIHLDGGNDSSISARIEFPQGISLSDGSESSPALNFANDTNTGIFGAANGIFFSVDGDTILSLFESGISTEQGMRIEKYGVRIMTSAQPFTFGTDAGAPSLYGVVNTGFYVTGGLVGGGGLKVYIRGATGDGFDNAGEKVYLQGGLDNTLGSGWVQIGESGVPGHWSTSVGAEDNFYVGGDVEIDGTTYHDGSTYIQTLTGILKATSGLVSTASGSDLLTAIGTIDISSNTNLAVSSPITLSGDTVGFDATANFMWTGTHDFQNNFSWNTAGSTSYLATFGNTSLSSPIVSPTGSADSVSITKQTTTSTTTRALTVQAEWAGTTASSSQPVNGFNAFVYTAASATQALTSSSAQGALRNRMVARHRATNASATVTRMAGLSAGAIIDAGAAAVTDAASFIAESESVGLAATVTNNYGLLALSNSTSGTITNNYGIYLTELATGTNRYEQFFDGGGGAFFRAAAQQIYSSAANTLDDDAGATRNFRIGGTTEATLTSTALELPSNDFAIASGAKVYFEGSGGDTYAYYDSGSSSLKFYVNGALAMELK